MRDNSREVLPGQRLLMPVLGITRYQPSASNSGAKDQSLGLLGKSATSRMYIKQGFKTLKKGGTGATTSREVSKGSSAQNSASIFDLTASRIARGKSHISKLHLRPQAVRNTALDEGRSLQELLASNPKPRETPDHLLALRSRRVIHHVKHASLEVGESLINQLKLQTARHLSSAIDQADRTRITVAALKRSERESRDISRRENESKLAMPASLPVLVSVNKLNRGKRDKRREFPHILQKPFEVIGIIDGGLMPLESKVLPLPKQLKAADGIRMKSREIKNSRKQSIVEDLKNNEEEMRKKREDLSPARAVSGSPMKTSMVTLDSQVGLKYKPVREKSCEKGKKVAKVIHSKIDICKFKNWLLSDPLTKQLYYKVSSIHSSK